MPVVDIFPVDELKPKFSVLHWVIWKLHTFHVKLEKHLLQQHLDLYLLMQTIARSSKSPQEVIEVDREQHRREYCSLWKTLHEDSGSTDAVLHLDPRHPVDQPWIYPSGVPARDSHFNHLEDEAQSLYCVECLGVVKQGQDGSLRGLLLSSHSLPVRASDSYPQWSIPFWTRLQRAYCFCLLKPPIHSCHHQSFHRLAQMGCEGDWSEALDCFWVLTCLEDRNNVGFSPTLRYPFTSPAAVVDLQQQQI